MRITGLLLLLPIKTGFELHTYICTLHVHTLSVLSSFGLCVTGTLPCCSVWPEVPRAHMQKVPQHRIDERVPIFQLYCYCYTSFFPCCSCVLVSSSCLSFLCFFLLLIYLLYLPSQNLIFQSFCSLCLFCFSPIHPVMLPLAHISAIFIHHHFSEVVSLLFSI